MKSLVLLGIFSITDLKHRVKMTEEDKNGGILCSLLTI